MIINGIEIHAYAVKERILSQIKSFSVTDDGSITYTTAVAPIEKGINYEIACDIPKEIFYSHMNSWASHRDVFIKHGDVSIELDLFSYVDDPEIYSNCVHCIFKGSLLGHLGMKHG